MLREMGWFGLSEGGRRGLALEWTQSRTHVGQGERAAAAALVGLLVASQLVERTRLAEQCPDVLAVQTQCLLAVLQRLLIQALPERSTCSASAPVTLPPPGLLLPSTGDRPPFPAVMEGAGGPGSGRRLQSSRKQLKGSRVSS